MNWAEWRAKYPGIPVVQPHPEALDVYLISGRDPLNQGGGTTWDPPMFELFELSDYHVTTSNVHRGSVWIAPRVERDDWTRADYMCSRCSHEAYYLSIARLIGLGALERIVLSIASREQLIEAFGTDPVLNNIPLSKWDGMHGWVSTLISEQNRSKGIMARTWNGAPLRPGTFCWSLSESVCVLKATARHVVERWQGENTPIAT